MRNNKRFEIHFDHKMYWVYDTKKNLYIKEFSNRQEAEYFVASGGKTKKTFWYRGYKIVRNVVEDLEDRKWIYMYEVYDSFCYYPLEIYGTLEDARKGVAQRCHRDREAARV